MLFSSASKLHFSRLLYAKVHPVAFETFKNFSTQLNLLIYGSCEAGLNKHREHIIEHKA